VCGLGEGADRGAEVGMVAAICSGWLVKVFSFAGASYTPCYNKHAHALEERQ
jgi:hypothetical protein